MNGSTNVLGVFAIAIVILTIIGPEKLPQSIEQLWLAIANLRRQQDNLEPITLRDARRMWKASGSPVYSIVGGLYQGAEHLSELRRRLMVSGIVMVVAALGSVYFATYIFAVLKAPAGNIQLIAVRPPETILTYFKVALLSGATFSMPLLVYQLLAFVGPAMETPRERRTFKLFRLLAVPAVLIFFVGGMSFSYFVLLPFAIRYLFSFGSELATPQWTISAYTSFVLSIIFWIGIAFETPLIILILVRLGVVTPRQLASKRKYAVVIIAVAAAIITPTPDPFNMALVMVPLLFLFELGILLGRIFGGREKKAELPATS